MSWRHSELIERFVKKSVTKGSAGRIYVEGDTLYSFGRHFPLLTRVPWGFVLNADKYSVTTSKHQSECFRYATVQVSLSTLRAARINVFEMILVDKVAQVWEKLDRWWLPGDPRKMIGKAEFDVLPDDVKEKCNQLEERRPEGCVLMYEGKYYLSSMDGQAYFLCQLPEPCKTVAEAFESLKPDPIKGREYQRQGEWFFVQRMAAPWQVKEMYKKLRRNFVLPRGTDSANRHIATRGDLIDGQVVVSGQIRHREHRMLKLSTLEDPKLFMAYCNRAVASWAPAGGAGRVD
jgi:hypothetical protein